MSTLLEDCVLVISGAQVHHAIGRIFCAAADAFQVRYEAQGFNHQGRFPDSLRKMHRTRHVLNLVILDRFELGGQVRYPRPVQFAGYQYLTQS